jgi:hypothetical protein
MTKRGARGHALLLIDQNSRDATVTSEQFSELFEHFLVGKLLAAIKDDPWAAQKTSSSTMPGHASFVRIHCSGRFFTCLAFSLKEVRL